MNVLALIVGTGNVMTKSMVIIAAVRSATRVTIVKLVRTEYTLDLEKH